jgi:hypothetical protein
MTHVFSVAEVRDLARNPDLDLGARREHRRSKGRGFSYPQERWLYRAAGAFYEGGRAPEILSAAFRTALAGGDRELSVWKRSVDRTMGSILDALVVLDGKGRGEYERSVFEYPARAVIWRNHGLRVPVGLVFCDANVRFVRMLWMDQKLQARSRGMILVAAATLAACERLDSIAAVETWHLRDGERRFFHAHDLRHSQDRLDRILTLAEGRLDTPPAAA